MIREKGGEADCLAIDVTDLDAVLAAIAERDPFHILINNAGTNRTDPFLDVKVEDFDLIIGLNVRAAFFVAQAVARKLGAREKGLDRQYLLADGAGRRRHAGASIARRNGQWKG